MAKAKPYWKGRESYDEEIANLNAAKIVFDNVFAREYPFEVTVSVSHHLAPSMWRIFFYLTEENQERTRELVQHIVRTFPVSKMTREFIEADGSFRWSSNSSVENLNLVGIQGESTLLILVEDASKEDCEIRKVKKTIDVFETDCKPVTEESESKEGVKS